MLFRLYVIKNIFRSGIQLEVSDGIGDLCIDEHVWASMFYLTHSCRFAVIVYVHPSLVVPVNCEDPVDRTVFQLYITCDGREAGNIFTVAFIFCFNPVFSCMIIFTMVEGQIKPKVQIGRYSGHKRCFQTLNESIVYVLPLIIIPQRSYIRISICKSNLIFQVCSEQPCAETYLIAIVISR